MAIIIADIHGDLEKVQTFLTYKAQAQHIALGDLVDSRKRGVTLEDELECLDLLFSSEAVFLWGNHDLAYTPERPWDCFTKFVLNSEDIHYYAGKSSCLKRLYEEKGTLTAYDIFTDRFNSERDRMKVAYAADGWLCTHAGVSQEKADMIPREIVESGTCQIAVWLNEEFQREFQTPVNPCSGSQQRYGSGPLFHVPRCRGGTHRFGGIFWFDPIGEMIDPSPLVGKQIFGHTPVPYPEAGSYWVNLNNFEEGIWIFDTETEKLLDISELKLGLM